MSKLPTIRSIAQTAEQASNVAFNALKEQRTVLNAERNGTFPELLHQAAAIDQARNGGTELEAYGRTVRRAEYMKELAAGQTTFHEADMKLKAERRKATAEIKAEAEFPAGLVPATS